MTTLHIVKNSTFIPFNRGVLEGSIGGYFRECAGVHGERVAVNSGGDEFTYGDLDVVSDHVAQALMARGGRGVEPVVVMMEKGASVIGALLGVLKAGKIYAPIDPSFPRPRIEYMLRETGARLIVCNDRNLAVAKAYAGDGVDLVNVDEIDYGEVVGGVDISVGPDDLAWILYTSGSTGQPKGVMQTHRNVLHYVMVYSNEMQICADDRFSLLYSCSVNGGAHEIFTALLNGACLYPYTIQVEGIGGIGRWIVDNRLTLYSSVPTVFRHFVETLDGGEDFGSLRFVKLIGEPVYKRDVDLFVGHFPGSCTLINRLGSSETGTIRWYFINRGVEIEGNNVPVGYAVQDNEVVLLDATGEEVETGEVGEIAVRSRYLSPGYWGKPDLTDKVFLPDAEDGGRRTYLSGDMGRMDATGGLVCLGRKDSQIKIRGYRVEAGEVEKAILDTKLVKDAFVMAVGQAGEDQQLVAYVVFKAQVDPAIPELRRSLADKLPTYMMPATFMVLDQLPLAPNGKVDRGALPKPDITRSQLDHPFVAPRNPLEATLAQIWCDVLGLEKIGVHDNFLQLGGDSIKALETVARVVSRLQVKIPIHHLLRQGTVEKMAEMVNQAHFKKSEEDFQNV